MLIPLRGAVRQLAWLVVALTAAAGWARGADHFLAIGGGDSPMNNQISLEKNVLFFQRLLVDSFGEGTGSDVLFSNGSANGRDVQFMPEQEPPRLNVLLARLYGRENDVYFEYRQHKLPGVCGSSTRKGLDEWFNTSGKKLGEGDRLFIYFTGHGGAGNNPAAQNTTISMWCEKPMHVTEFVGLLDRLSPKVQVVLIMVQCHSGGFASAIYKDGKAGGPLSPARRCGFFATTFDRIAAGCTADTVEDDYKDYSTYFFAALDGKTRTGKPVTGCDLDGDGHVSLAEAHAYVLLHSDTIDLPTTTSEGMLRQFSKTGGSGLATPQMAFKDLLEKASPVQKAVLDGLSEQLKLSADDRLDESKRVAELVEAERKTVERERNQKMEEAGRLAERIRSRMIQRWPELPNPWHPRVAELLKSEGPQIQQAIENDSDCPRWELVQRDADQLFERGLNLERRWVTCQRFARMLETVALEANLEKVASPAIVERYKQMIEDEAGIFSQRVAQSGDAKSD